MADFRLLLSGLNNAFKQKSPFVAYRKPNEIMVKGLIQENTDVHYVDKLNNAGFIFAPFSSEEKTILIPYTESKYLEVSSPEKKLPHSEKLVNNIKDGDKAKYIDLINKTLHFIKEEKAKKIVISRKEEIELSNFSFLVTFERLLQTYTNALVYVWFHPTIGLWLGATPEKLISIVGNRFNTVALAGTQIYHNTEDVEWGAKEFDEQQIVTDFITSNLASLVSDITVSGPETIKAGSLLHISTSIEGTINDQCTIDSLVSSLHPTPAICGMPRNVAKQYILENESYDREFYTGFLGEINSKSDINLFVNLRCMKVEGDKVALFLGGGITRDSRSANEWNETVAKSKIIKKVI